MTPEQLDALKVDLSDYANWAPTTRILVLQIFEEYAAQRALIEQQAGVIQRQWDYIAQLKQTISVHEQAGLEGLVRDYNDHQRIEQQAKEIERLKIEYTEINAAFDHLNEVITRQMGEIARITELAKGYHDTTENRTNDIEQQAREIARLRDKLERISRHVPIMGSTGDYRQGQLDVLESVKRIAEGHP